MSVGRFRFEEKINRQVPDMTHDMILRTWSNLLHFFLSHDIIRVFLPCDHVEAHLSVLRDSARTASALFQLEFCRCWRGRLTLILSVTMFSNYHSRHTNTIAWLAVLFPWQLLWFWLCQSFCSLYSTWHQIAVAWAARFFFISLCVSGGCLRYVPSLWTAEKLF